MGFLKKIFEKKEVKIVDKKAVEPVRVKEISVDELKKKIDNKEDFVLVDIRTEQELQFGKIKYKQLFIPMHELPSRLNELDKDKEIILYCRTGNRTYGTAEYLMQLGFNNLKSLDGGIMAWKKFDDSIVSY